MRKAKKKCHKLTFKIMDAVFTVDSTSPFASGIEKQFFDFRRLDKLFVEIIFPIFIQNFNNDEFIPV